MRVAVIGAGIAGLGAARSLRAAGVASVVFEKSAGLGGRCATRRADPYILDSGATHIAPRGRALERLMTEELDASSLVRIERPVWTMAYGRVSPGDANRLTPNRYAYPGGITTLAKLMAADLDVRLQTPVESVETAGERVVVAGEEFSHAILAVPPAPAVALLGKDGGRRPLANVRYRSCLSVLLGASVDSGDRAYSALLEPEQRSPVIWISLEHLKCADRAPSGHTALVVQFGANYSRDHYEDSDAEILDEALKAVTKFFGAEMRDAEVRQVKRWRYSQPEMLGTFEANNPPGCRVVVCGDGLAGPRVELAYESGLAAAHRILESPS